MISNGKIFMLIAISTLLTTSGCGSASEVASPSSVSSAAEGSSTQEKSAYMSTLKETVTASEPATASSEPGIASSEPAPASSDSITDSSSAGQRTIEVSDIDMYNEDNDLTVWDNDKSIIDKCLNLPQKNYDEAPSFEEFDIYNADNNELNLIKLESFKEEGITVYALKNEKAYGVIVDNGKKKQFEPCEIWYRFDKVQMGLADITGDGNKELVLISNAVYANGFPENREVLWVLCFDENGDITMHKLTDKDMVDLLNEKISYDSDALKVLIKEDGNLVDEIPISAFEEDYSHYELETPIEDEIEFIDYVNCWYYSVTDAGLLLTDMVRYGGKNITWGVGISDDKTPKFDVLLKDGKFNLAYVKK